MTSGIDASSNHAVQDNVVSLHATTREERKQAVTAFVRDHPGLSLAGGLLAGIMVSRLLPRKPLSKLAGKATALSELAGVAALTLGRRAIEQVGAAGSELRERGGNLAGQAEGLAEAAASRVGNLGHEAAGLAGAAASRAGSLGHEAAERIEKLGEAAASRLGKAGVTPDKIEKLGATAASAGSAALERAGELLAPVEAKVEDVVKRIAQTASDLRAKVHS
ncbi:MAG: hypothetical protein ABIT04_12060 [Novosphingobium sp.]